MPSQQDRNSITFFRHENASGADGLMAEIDRRKRRMDRFDVWLFLSVWIIITTAAGAGLLLHN